MELLAAPSVVSGLGKPGTNVDPALQLECTNGYDTYRNEVYLIDDAAWSPA
jgi:hypothetical protein